jgi:hypothetical protein
MGDAVIMHPNLIGYFSVIMEIYRELAELENL